MSRFKPTLFLALMTAGCTNLYPEKSEDREREHEFMEMHMKHIGK
jgi:hypothetical protein